MMVFNNLIPPELIGDYLEWLEKELGEDEPETSIEEEKEK